MQNIALQAVLAAAQKDTHWQLQGIVAILCTSVIKLS